MNDVPGLHAFLAELSPVAGQLPWPRHHLDLAGWRVLARRLDGSTWSLLGLWGEPATIHAAFRDEVDGAVAAVNLNCPERRYPSLSVARPAAIRLERAARDLFGLIADGAVDERPWLDHGRWREDHPLARPRLPGEAAPAKAVDALDYPFLPVDGDGLHQIPVGPVHAGIIEPGHFRFHANGETVVRLEERLGYVHKGVEKLMQGKSAGDAIKVAARLSGDSSVALGLGFARAAEAATLTEVPARAHWLRALMAELERMANHFGDIGAICNDASFTFIHAHCSAMREAVLRSAASCFGHRLMMDCVVPGGVAADLTSGGTAELARLVNDLAQRFEYVMRIYDAKASLLDRTLGTGVTLGELVHRFGAGGYVGRAAGRSFDARRNPGYPPYDELDFDVPTMTEADVHARLWIRVEEIRQSLKIVRQILAHLPMGPVQAPLRARAGEGMALIEAFRGECLTYVRLDVTGHVERAHQRDASWFHWPLLESAVLGNIVADFPLCNKSINGSYSGHDL
ncbi:MAG: hydrogenase expression protein HypE [Alphaproteobacteria bacterium]|nr:hydrogenase expression protein HypE [Alphaproteobacteria bacterium]